MTPALSAFLGLAFLRGGDGRDRPTGRDDVVAFAGIEGTITDEESAAQDSGTLR